MALEAHYVKDAARGHWPAVLAAAGIASDLLDGRHHPCPKCGGTDRFRAFNDVVETGGVFCNQCCTDCGDGLGAVQWMNGSTFPEALQFVASYLGIGEHSELPSVDPLTRLARLKSVPVDSLEAFGATVENGRVVFPVFDGDGKQASAFYFEFGTPKGEKGLFPAGGTHGVFLPTDGNGPRLPQPGETWQLVEGVKDAAALNSLGYNAAGMPTSNLAAKFIRLLAGVNVIIVPDRDAAGSEGAEQTAARLYGTAASVKIAALPVEYQATNGADVRDVLKKRDGELLVRSAIDSAAVWKLATGTAEQKPAEVRPITFQRITAAELDAGFYELEYHLAGCMSVGQPLILAGPKKALKTSIMLDAFISIASGKPFLGKIEVTKPGRVAVMSGESGLATLQESCRRISRSKGLRFGDLAGFIISPDLPQIAKPDHLEALRQFLIADEITAVGIDPAYLAMPGDDPANMFKMGDYLRGVAQVCTDCGVTLALAHHTKKNLTEPFQPLELDAIAWSGFGEFARQWQLVNRREPYIPGSGEHRLWFSVGGSAGHSALWALDVSEGEYDGVTPRVWEVSLTTAGNARESAKQEQSERREHNRKVKWKAAVDECKEAIANALMLVPDHCETKRMIESRSGKSGKALDEALAVLLRSGRMKEAKVKRGNSHEYDGFQYIYDSTA